MTTPNAAVDTENTATPTIAQKGIIVKQDSSKEAQKHPQLEHYRYEILPDAGSSIRLATIQPGKFNDRLELSLRTSPFTPENPPLYEALSYVWGSEKDPQVLLVGSSTHKGVLHVTQNLVGALRHLRREEEPRVVWIDAVCINQADNVEKGPQVAMMGRIYQLASRVIVWLGPAADQSDLAMGLMNGMGQQVEVDFNHYALGPSKNASDGHVGDRTSPLPYGKEQLCTLCRLMSRPWFERLWVRQEIYLSKSAVVQCGLSRMSWPVFRKAWYCLYAKPWPDFEFAEEIFKRMRNLYGFLHQPRTISLLDLKELFSTAKCKDGRDRIYGILQLLDRKERDALSIQPDYTKPVVDVFQDVTLAYLSHNPSANILIQCQPRPDAPGPSWVPNWESNNQGELFLPSASRASGPLESQWSQPRPGILRMSGVSVGTVEHLLEHGIASSSSNQHLVVEIYRLMREAQSRSGNGAGDASFKRTFTRTLFLDRFSEHYAPPGGFPSISDGVRFVEGLARADGDDLAMSQIAAKAEICTLLNRFRFYIHGNKPMITNNGSIGLAPAFARRGDKICVLLGCDRPMLLRPELDNSYRVIGPCFLADIQFGEALFGHLPVNIQPQSRWNEQEARREHGFYCSISGQFTLNDPRLERGRANQVYCGERSQQAPQTGLRFPSDILRKTGVIIKDFDLL